MRADRVVELAPEEIRRRQPQLVELLADAIDGGASVGYLLPYRIEDLDAHWRVVASEVEDGKRVVLASIDSDRIIGGVQLVPSGKTNQPHRADVQKLLVLRSERQRGVGKALMDALEQCARATGRWLLTLDTRSGSAADALYQCWGWQQVGPIPDYALDPDGQPAACTFYWKRLA